MTDPGAAPAATQQGQRWAWPGLPPGRALALPGGFTLALLLFGLLTPVRQHPELLRAFLGAGGALALWGGGLCLAARRSGRTLTLDVALHRHHWVQAIAQLSVLLYWGWHVRFVYAFVPLILAQLIFAYGIEALLTWSRRDRYTLGFGPFPVVFSINLFLWFRPEWFHWQFAMVAVGYLAKDLIRWTRDGRSAHIFNPSSFPLAVFALTLILTGTTEMTFGREIATSYSSPPYIYAVIFLAALPGQVLFGVARMTMPAVVTIYAISLLYFAGTGTYLFYDTHIPVPVFLGMHLLLTDPSTSPRSDLGRIMFGMLYAVLVVAGYVLLLSAGAPSYFDKLLPLPILNLMARRLDLFAASAPLAWLDPSRLGRTWKPVRRNLVYVSVWVGIFAAMHAAQGVGDRHPGQFLPFWEEACAEGSARGCNYAIYRKFTYCRQGSGWACNEWGVDLVELQRPARPAFERGCELGFSPACDNASQLESQALRTIAPGRLARAGPSLEDLPIVLRGKQPIRARGPAELYALACRQGWPGMCARVGMEAQP